MQPVTPTALVVNYIKVSGLYGSFVYKLNNTSWETPSATTVANAPILLKSSIQIILWSMMLPRTCTSGPGCTIACNGGTQKMKFDVNLTVKYKDGSQTKTSTDSYFATIEKALLPGNDVSV